MSAGTRVRTFRLSDSEHDRIVRWGQAHLGTQDFSAILRHLIRQALRSK